MQVTSANPKSSMLSSALVVTALALSVALPTARSQGT
jgi:hypothetical protein